MEPSNLKGNGCSVHQESTCTLQNMTFITTFTKAQNVLIHSQINSTHSHCISLESILTLSSHLHQNLPSCLFTWGFHISKCNYLCISSLLWMPNALPISLS